MIKFRTHITKKCKLCAKTVEAICNKENGVLLFLVFFTMCGYAEEFQGIDFPDGASSFADVVVSFIPGSYGEFEGPVNDASNTALGIAGPQAHVSIHSVSMGNGGTLVLRFADNSLTTSGNSNPDLWIFEIGPAIEAADIEISTDGINWISVGRIEGSKSGLDIDGFVGEGVIPGERYSFVKLIDDFDDDFQDGPFAGADIDAVGAISSDIPVIVDCIDGIEKPHTFLPHTPAKASEVNENFDILYDAVNRLACNLQQLPNHGSMDELVVDNEGNVGIGTADPKGKLDVNGSIFQRGGHLHADYVFEPKYKLETIEQHADYMWKNKHLTAIPKAREDENGLEIIEVGAHRKGIVEELEKAHIYIEQLEIRLSRLEKLLSLRQ